MWFSSWCRHKNGFEVFTNSKDVNNKNCATCIFITHLIVSFYHTLSQILFMQQMFVYLCLCNGSNEIKLCIIFLSPCFVRFDTFLSIHLFRIAFDTMPNMYWQSHEKCGTQFLVDKKQEVRLMKQCVIFVSNLLYMPSSSSIQVQHQRFWIKLDICTHFVVYKLFFLWHKMTDLYMRIYKLAVVIDNIRVYQAYKSE